MEVDHYSYERIENGDGVHYRVRDGADNRVATCYTEENARLVTEALNHQAVRILGMMW